MKRRCAVAALVAGMVQAQTAAAGMPSVGFSEVARSRLETISFFLLGIVLSAVVVLLVWNYLAREFPRLPRLTYGRALGVVVLWGLLFVIVLTMISGARELMTPGAWEKNGATYKLRQAGNEDSPSTAADEKSLAARRGKLEQLGVALRAYAAEHGGKFPAARDDGAIADELWTTPHGSQMRYVYLPARSDRHPLAVVAFEPELYDGEPLALLAGGEVVPMSRDRLDAIVKDAGL